MIQVDNLSKDYGNGSGVFHLNFHIPENGVYGFLGPNGAGKSTTMNVITGCLAPTEGTVKVDGHDILEEPEKARGVIGYLPEQPPLYVNETPREYLRFVGEAKGLKGQELRGQIEFVMHKTGITDVADRLISALSKGYKQRVGIAQALLGNPKVIILDEPTVGLDPIQIIEIRELIKSLGESHTVIFSSHILSEVQAICQQIIIIDNGRLIAYDTPSKLEEQLSKSNGIYVSVVAAKDRAEEILQKNLPELTFEAEEISESETRLHILLGQEAGAEEAKSVCISLFGLFARENHAIYEMHHKKATLEEVFLELTEKAKFSQLEEEADEAEMPIEPEMPEWTVETEMPVETEIPVEPVRPEENEEGEEDNESNL